VVHLSQRIRYITDRYYFESVLFQNPGESLPDVVFVIDGQEAFGWSHALVIHYEDFGRSWHSASGKAWPEGGIEAHQCHVTDTPSYLSV
jgi:hypothetical protein